MHVLVGLLLLALAPGVVWAFWCSGRSLVRSANFMPILAGFGLGLFVERILWKRARRFSTFEHELTHAIAALLFFRQITGFRVSRLSGHCRYLSGFGGRVGDDFISLAPYVLPTFTLFSVAVRPVLPGVLFPWFDVWIGLTFGYHFVSNIRELRPSWGASSLGAFQEDLRSSGVVFSLLYILVLSLAISGLLAAVVASGYRGVYGWAKSFWSGEIAAARWGAGVVASLLRRLGRGA